MSAETTPSYENIENYVRLNGEKNLFGDGSNYIVSKRVGNDTEVCFSIREHTVNPDIPSITIYIESPKKVARLDWDPENEVHLTGIVSKKDRCEISFRLLPKELTDGEIAEVQEEMERWIPQLLATEDTRDMKPPSAIENLLNR